MPLLRKSPFRRASPPENVGPEDLIFYCESTKEAFKDYEDFFRRTILCNSLVWSCSLTGKSGLTYEEALESEKKAKSRLGILPRELKRGLLWSCHHARRGRLGDLADDVYKFSSGRYFIGEKVEVVINDLWCESIIKEVLPPTSQEITADAEGDESDKRKKKGFFPPEHLFKYKVQETDPDDPQNNPIVTATAENVRREKWAFTRDKNLLFLKNASELGSDGNFKLKKSILDKYHVEKIAFADIFAGPEPVFEETKRVKGLPASSLNKKTKQASMDQWVKGDANVKKKTPAEIEAEMKRIREQNERFKEEMRLRAEETRKRKLEEKSREKERKKEEKKLLNELMSEWTKAREDLTCEDHKNLPVPKPVHCRVPNHLFGDFIMLMEFYSGFSEVLETNDSFPQGITFEMLESALCTMDSISTDFYEILSFTLGALFDLQREEEEEVKTNKTVTMSADMIEKNSLGKNADVINQIRSATEMSQWSRKTQGQSMSDLHLDQWSITEILRIHLESAGAFKGDKLGLWRYQQRGGYRLYDDPGLHFRMEEPQILDVLRKKTVFELSLQEKLKILNCLMEQVISFATVRDEIDDRFNSLLEAKADLRNHIINENRRIRLIEETKKAKLKEEKNKKEEEQQQPPSMELTTRQKGAIQSQKEREEKDSLKKEELLKTEALEKERAFQGEVAKLQARVMMSCLGRDRSYRRFWTFDTLPGIFVEDEDEFVGSCLPEPTPYNPDAAPLSETQAMDKVREIMNAREKQQNTSSPSSSSDKENDNKEDVKAALASSTKTYSRKPQQKVLSAMNGDSASESTTQEEAMTTNTELSSDTQENSSEQVKIEEVDKPHGLCSADIENCPVHSVILPRTRWSFYSSEKDLESLINNLNPRGIREKELRDKLIAEKDGLTKNLKRFNIEHKLVQNDESMDVKKNTDSINILADSTLRDQILDLEEKIFFGTLGTLKVQSREKWQNAIQNGEYDKQCDSVNLSGSKASIHNTPSESQTQSRSGSPALTEPTNGLEADVKKIKTLASAILQVGQMIDDKYLKEPLSESEKEKKKRLKEERRRDEEDAAGSDDSTKLNEPGTPFQQWERSLMFCTSYAQLFIHLTTLENSVIWSKSVMNTRCRLCRRKTDPDKMLLCDGCDRGHHMYCLKPKIKMVPEGDWFCNDCKPKERIRSPKKSRRVFSTIGEDDDGEEQSDSADTAEEDDLEAQSNDEETADEGDSNDDKRFSEEEEDLEESPRQKKSKNPKKGLKKPSPELPVTKKRRTITQLLGKRRCATEASEKIHKSAQETSSGNSSGTDSSSAETAKESGERTSSRLSARSKVKRNLESIASTTNLKNATSKKKRNRQEESEIDFTPTVLEDLLNCMMKHKDGWPFDRPITKTDAPDYHKIIKRPMDLGTIRSGINRMKYSSNFQVLDEIKLVFDNCFTYNREDAEEYGCGVRLEKYFLKEVTRLGLGHWIEGTEENQGKQPPSKKARKTL